MILWICDVNGVLVDTVAAARDAFAATAVHGRFRFGDAEYRAVKSRTLLEAYRMLDPGGDPVALRTFHRRYLRDRLAGVRAYPQVGEILRAARACDIRIGAATSHGETAESCLVRTDLYPYIDCLVTQEEVKRSKPHPDCLLQILALFDVDPRHRASGVLYVGDSPLDIEAGKAAQVVTVGVTYGVCDEGEIAAAEPDYVIHSFGEMRRFIDQPPASLVERTRANPVAALRRG